MKFKKLLMFIGIILLLIFVIVLGWLVIKNKNAEKDEIKEIIPEEEISTEQIRQTIVTLYFMSKNEGTLQPEARQIDAKLLIENPYEILINMLLEGPKNEQLIELIPQGTKLNSAEIKNDIVYIDFSSEFINEQTLGEKQEMMIINSILKTLSELNEVDGIKIIIDGKENMSFQDNEVSFNTIFYIE